MAWVRFTDGPEVFEGKPYHWLGRSELHLTFDVRPQPGDALGLSWGAKSDRRDAAVRINGQSVSVEDGGHWGFRWLRIPIPEGVKGDHYEIDLKRGQLQPAFLSEIRLTASSRDPNRPDLKQSQYKGKLTLTPAAGAAAPLEAFPEMRKVWDRELPLPATGARPASGAAACEP